MKIFRTCAPKSDDAIEHFLDDLDEIRAIRELVPAKSMLEEVFSREKSENSSRFCPPYFLPCPLYTSESDTTTFYEYCFHLLNNKNITGDKPLKATLYYLDLIGSPKKKDLTKKIPAGVMNKKSYVKAHAFVKSLTPFPDVIKYKSVRDILKKENYAIYSQKFVKETGADPRSMIISFVNSKSVHVTIEKETYLLSPKF